MSDGINDQQETKKTVRRKKEGLKDYFVTMSQLAEMMLENEKNENKESVSEESVNSKVVSTEVVRDSAINEKEEKPKKVRKKTESVENKKHTLEVRFKEILKEIGFRKEISYYMSAKDTKKSGIFIFNPENTFTLMSKLLDIFKYRKGAFTSEEIEKVKEYLIGLLPEVTNLQDISIIIEEGYKRDLDKLVDLINEIRELEILSVCKDKEIKRIKAMVEKIYQCKIISGEISKTDIEQNGKEEIAKTVLDSDENKRTVSDILCEFNLRKRKVLELVTDFYIRERGKFFEDKIFIRETKENNIDNLYLRQYMLLKKWSVKWINIIKNVKQIRKAERFIRANDILSKKDVPQNMKWEFYESVSCLEEENARKYNKIFMEIHNRIFWIGIADLVVYILEDTENIEVFCEPQEQLRQGETWEQRWFDMCNDCVDDVLNESKTQIYIEDKNFLLIKAFKELEVIRSIVQKGVEGKLEEKSVVEKKEEEKVIDKEDEIYKEEVKKYKEEVRDAKEEDIEKYLQIQAKWNARHTLLDYPIHIDDKVILGK